MQRVNCLVAWYRGHGAISRLLVPPLTLMVGVSYDVKWFCKGPLSVYWIGTLMATGSDPALEERSVCVCVCVCWGVYVCVCVCV